MILVEEVVGQLVHILAIPELGQGYLASLLEGPILVQNLMDLVFDLGFQIQVFQQPRDHFRNVLGLGVLGLQDLVLNDLFDRPEDV